MTEKQLLMTAIWMIVYPASTLFFGGDRCLAFGVFVGVLCGAVGMALVKP